MKSLEVTVILVAKADGVASVVHERYIARHCQRQTYGALRVVAVQERFKSLAFASAKSYGACRVIAYKNVFFKSLTYVSAESYGARRVVVKSSRYRGTRFYYLFLKSILRYILALLIDLLFSVNQYY